MTGSLLPVKIRMSAQKKSLYMNVNSSVASAASAGLQSGSVTDQKIFQIGRAVDDRRLGQLGRQGLHEVAEHEHAEAELEGDVDDHDAEVLVVEQAVVAQDAGQRQRQVEPVERRDDDLRRQQVRGGEEHQQREVEAPPEARHRERDHRRQEEDDDHARDDDDQRVEEVVRDLAWLQAVT